MSKFDSKKITPRYSFIAIVLMFVAVSVVARAMYIMTARRDFWLDVADRVPVNPVRGNILSSDGLLMVSTLPEYKLLVDFETMHNSGTDSLWLAKIDSITEGLSAIFPQKSAAYFKEYLKKGYDLKSSCWPVWPDRVSYNTYMEVKSLPPAIMFTAHLRAVRSVNCMELKTRRATDWSWHTTRCCVARPVWCINVRCSIVSFRYRTHSLLTVPTSSRQ